MLKKCEICGQEAMRFYFVEEYDRATDTYPIKRACVECVHEDIDMMLDSQEKMEALR